MATANSLNGICKFGDELLDLAETIEIAADPRTDERFDAARMEVQAGHAQDFFSLPI